MREAHSGPFRERGGSRDVAVTIISERAFEGTGRTWVRFVFPLFANGGPIKIRRTVILSHDYGSSCEEIGFVSHFGGLSVSEPANGVEGGDDLPFLRELRWTEDGLIAAIVQEAGSGVVLMMAWMDEAAVRATIRTGQTHFYSRSRRRSWHKGESSGHVQTVESIHVDCDADVLLIRARQVGGACHEGYHSCFARRVDADGQLRRELEPVFAAEAVYGPKPTSP